MGDRLLRFKAVDRRTDFLRLRSEVEGHHFGKKNLAHHHFEQIEAKIDRLNEVRLVAAQNLRVPLAEAKNSRSVILSSIKTVTSSLYLRQSSSNKANTE